MLPIKEKLTSVEIYPAQTFFYLKQVCYLLPYVPSSVVSAMKKHAKHIALLSFITVQNKLSHPCKASCAFLHYPPSRARFQLLCGGTPLFLCERWSWLTCSTRAAVVQ